MLPSLLPLLGTLQLASALCYTITSQLVTNTDTQPCNNIQGVVSMCCATNRGSSSQFTADTCLPNGLCQNIFTNQTTKKPDTNYWRETCSDSGWNSKYCLKDICWGTSEIDGSGNAEMTPCDGTATSEKWCCGTHNTACCGTGKEILLAAVLGVSSTSTSASSTASSTFSSTSPPTSSATTTQGATQSANPNFLTTGAKAGIGVSVTVVAVIALLGALYFWLRRREMRRGQVPEYGVTPSNAPDSEGFLKSELPGAEDSRYKNATPNRTDVWNNNEPVEMQDMGPRREGEYTRTELP